MGTVSGLLDTASLPESGSSTIGLITLDGKGAGKPYEGKPHVRLCVQRRLVCSAGVSPAMLEVRRHIAWIARWRETKILKPIDNVTGRVAASCQAVTEVNAVVASKVRNPEGRAYNRRAKATWITEN